ncbi:MAG: NAD-dependent epimerase/dehydratase family protein [bacterium]|nr:NAD-dependent epimerase/dehydratase family protein [bacterium]
MRCLVTGGAGFIASHVVDNLRRRGIEVRIFDQRRSEHSPDCDHFIGSILDLEALRLAMNGVHAVFHLAAVADVKDVFDDPIYAENVNTRGTIYVLEAARRAGVKRVIYGSTTWVYSDAEGDLVDESVLIPPPKHLYTATKLTGEHYCCSYAELYGLDYTIFRYGIPYGPRARDGAVVPIFVSKALRGEPLTIAGDGSQFRQFVYVEDLAEGNVLGLQSVARNKIYNLDGDRKVTIREIAETIQRILGDVEIQYVEGRPGDFGGKVAVSSLAKKELGWEPNVDFEEGVRRYIEWFKEREKKRVDEWDRVDDLLKR